MPNKPLVKDTPTINIDYDKYGYCVKCHKNMLTQKVLTADDGRLYVEDMWSADKKDSRVLLDDGSKATITICKSCLESLTDHDYKSIMKSIIKGWEMEINEMVEKKDKEFKLWDSDKKKNYLKRYSKRKIICGIDNMPEDIIKKRYEEYINNSIKAEDKIGSNN